MKTAESPTTDINQLLDAVQQMMDQGRAAQALDMLNTAGNNSQAARNARGVCLLRLGKIEEAVRLFRDLVYPGNAIVIPRETPAVFRANHVTALLLSQEIINAGSLLDQIPQRDHPAVQRLRQAIRTWKRTLPLWRRMLLLIGICPQEPVTLDGAPGELWRPGAPHRPQKREA
ncbi:MAG: hypothetical protein IT445_04735 [Phycisphaeraceae bacterium]|nr:hypothetical protein [Phycisphaeraceae bacterium]